MERQTVKNIISLIVVLMPLNCAVSAEKKEISASISCSGAWAMYPTVAAWAEAFRKKYPETEINVSAGGSGKGVSDVISGFADIGMVSRDPYPAETEKEIIFIHILRDAVFPVISSKNPFSEDLLIKGINKKNIAGLYVTGGVIRWNDLAGNITDKLVHLYTRSDSCGAAGSWASYLGKKQEDLRGVGIYGDPGLLNAVARDPFGLSYSNFSYLFTRKGEIIEGIHIVPIDFNENGVADPDEIYKNRGEASKAILSGKYPAERKNYFAVKVAPQGLVKEFVKFALSDEGTKIADEIGTSLPLPKEKRNKELKKIE